MGNDSGAVQQMLAGVQGKFMPPPAHRLNQRVSRAQMGKRPFPIACLPGSPCMVKDLVESCAGQNSVRPGRQFINQRNSADTTENPDRVAHALAKLTDALGRITTLDLEVTDIRRALRNFRQRIRRKQGMTIGGNMWRLLNHDRDSARFCQFDVMINPPPAAVIHRGWRQDHQRAGGVSRQLARMADSRLSAARRHANDQRDAPGDLIRSDDGAAQTFGITELVSLRRKAIDAKPLRLKRKLELDHLTQARFIDLAGRIKRNKNDRDDTHQAIGCVRGHVVSRLARYNHAPKHTAISGIVEEKMKALTLQAEWAPKPGYALTDTERETRKVKTGSQVWKNPRIEVGSVPDPTPKDDEVIIEVASVGICGSDMHMYEQAEDGYILYPGLTRFPNILGHEFSGRVVETGSAVRDLKPGDLVTAEEIQWCGVCTACRRGLFNHCIQMEELGFTTPGAMAQYIPVRARYCWKIDEIAERIGDEHEALVMGAMVEPTGVSYHAMFNRLQTWKPGAYVVVFGAGPIGLTAEALAIAAGASQVIVFDTSPSRRAMAERLGAAHVLDPVGLEINSVLRDLTYGHGVDFVVEAAGAPGHTLAPLTTGLAVGATITHIGRSERPTPLSLEHYQVYGVQLAGSLGHAGHGTFQNVIRMMASGRLDLRPMVSARLPLDEAHAAFTRLRSREDAKIILHPHA